MNHFAIHLKQIKHGKSITFQLKKRFLNSLVARTCGWKKQGVTPHRQDWQMCQSWYLSYAWLYKKPPPFRFLGSLLHNKEDLGDKPSNLTSQNQKMIAQLHPWVWWFTSILIPGPDFIENSSDLIFAFSYFEGLLLG